MRSRSRWDASWGRTNDHENLRIRVDLPHYPYCVHTVSIWEFEVHESDVGTELPEQINGLVAGSALRADPIAIFRLEDGNQA